MKREDIKSYAREKAQDRYCTNENRMQRYMIAQIHAYSDGFLDAANWRIDSVWHDVKENPKNDKMLLLILDNGCSLIGGPHNNWWESTVRELNVKRWAYIDDLRPENL